MLLIEEGNNYSIASECREPRIPSKFRALRFKKIVSQILGKKVFVSVVFVRQAKIQKINKQYRKIDKSTDVLAFKLENGGEILLSLNDARKKARAFESDYGEYLSYLLIHALLHLKGLSHSSKMDKQEKKFCKTFQIKYPSNNK